MKQKQNMPNGHALFRRAVLMVTIAGLGLPGLVSAQVATAPDRNKQIRQLQQQIIEIQQESTRKLEELQRETEARMKQLQEQIDQLSASGPASPESTPSDRLAEAGTIAEAGAEPDEDLETQSLAAAEEAPSTERHLHPFGDFRLRYEANSSVGEIPSWDRGVLRGRLGAWFNLNDDLKLGARLVTGDPDNPRTADVTIGDFDNDFQVSLDIAAVAYEQDQLFLTGGKFFKPFNSTELVWDGDVNIQGLGGSFELAHTDRGSAEIIPVWFLINHKIFEESSDMLGGQLALSFQPEEDWTLSLNAAYWDYDFGILTPEAQDRARGNNLAPDGLHYLSDFNLLDTMATVNYKGLGDRWTVKLVGDYVKNLGAAVPEDGGYLVDLFIGSVNQPGDYIFHYGYSQAETDAVVAYFSNDNIIYPTNYQEHVFSVDYAITNHAFLGLTSYMFRRLDPDLVIGAGSNDWAFRTRLNLYFVF